ncbi:MAG: hypothetical protein ISR91_03505 [Candidatus Delongbacteria bacterium]|nr:hypothetical protein [Candidatus Delongbacteria bacterium]
MSTTVFARSGTRRRYRVTFRAIALMLGLSSPLAAGEYAGAYLDYGADARGLALGGACGALCDNATSFYWNPARLAYVTGLEVDFMYASHFGSLREPLGYYYYVGAALPLGQATLALNFVRFAVNDIPRYPAYPDDQYSVAERAAAIHTRGGTPDGWFRDREQALYLSFAKMNRFMLDLGWLYFSIPLEIPFGGNVKILSQQLDNATARGIGIDAGVSLQADLEEVLVRNDLGRLTFSVVLSDLTRTGLDWDSKVDAIPPGLRLGAAWEIPLGRFDLRLAREVAYKYKNRYRHGLEIEYNRMLALRAGYDHDQPAFGAGFRYNEWGFDYALLATDLGPMHRISGRYTF